MLLPSPSGVERCAGYRCSMDRLGREDARILGLESATIAGHTCKVVLAERPPDVADVVAAMRAAVAARAGRVPRVRQRLASTPLRLAPPAWVDDPDFDPARHVVAVPAGGVVSAARLREIVAERFATRLPRDRPLWRIDVVDALEDGGIAYIMLIHHAMADGVAALRMGAAVLWDDEPDPPVPSTAPWVPAAAPGAPALLVAGARARAASTGAAMGRLVRDLRAPSHLRRPSPRVLVRALRRRGADSPLDAPIGGHRRVAFVHASLGDFKRIRAAAGGGSTINDVVLAAVAGALRAWLSHRGIAAPRMTVKVPVSMHHGDEEPSAMGNRDSFFFADLPVAEPDAGRCLAAVTGETTRRKREGDADALYLFFGDLARVSRAVERRVERLAASPHSFSLCVSNVPGPPGPRWILGGGVRKL